MSLAQDLLLLAGHLARREPRRPKQASLRRALSTCYYALFWLLAQDCARLLLPRHVRDAAQRMLDHAALRRTAQHIVQQQRLPAPWDEAWNAQGTIAGHLRFVAEAVLRLQDLRHRADYDPGAWFTRSDALRAVEHTEDAFAAWRQARAAAEADAKEMRVLHAFAGALLFGRHAR